VCLIKRSFTATFLKKELAQKRETIFAKQN
jgi:hypothetical protein